MNIFSIRRRLRFISERGLREPATWAYVCAAVTCVIFLSGLRKGSTSLVTPRTPVQDSLTRNTDSSVLNKAFPVDNNGKLGQDAEGLKSPSALTTSAPNYLGGKSERCTKPVETFVIIKTHKCASTTLQNIGFRFAYDRNLTVVLPAAGNFFTALGWPREARPFHLLPHPSNGQFDVLANHIIYNRRLIQKFVKPAARYFGVLRHPFRQFSSLFDFLGLGSELNIALEAILDNPWKYNSSVQISYPPQGPIPLRNFMAMQFGFMMADSNDSGIINSFVKKIDNEFSLILIFEYFDESLILLMRKMCWTYLDILYFKLNPSQHRPKVPLEELYSARHWENHKKWSAADYALYDHFNKSLWSDIQQEANFKEDIATFRDLKQRIHKFCNSGNPPFTMSVPLSLHGKEEREINKLFCGKLGIKDIDFSKKFAARQYPDMDSTRFAFKCCKT